MKKYGGLLVLILGVAVILSIANSQIKKDASILANTPTFQSASANGDMENTGESTEEPGLSYPGYEYVFPEEKYPYRAMLSFEEQKEYNQIYANALNNNKSFKTIATISKNRMPEIVDAVCADHPELFWLTNGYHYMYERNTGNVTSIELDFYEFGNLEAAKAEFNREVNIIVEGSKKYSTDIEKEKYIHDEVASRATSDYSAPYTQSAYSALVSGKTVCGGYARALQLCMRESGIISYYVYGEANGGAHAWNVVKIGDSFYEVDGYWDDYISEGYGKSVYPFFNLTTEQMNVDHRRLSVSVYLPDSMGEEYTFEKSFGDTLSVDEIRSHWNSNN